jgi:streptomycin 3"-adenylyltransferase
LVSLMLGVSGWRGHAHRFPDAAHGRPIELTSVVVDDIQPWSDRARRDFQYGEWLRGNLTSGHIPQPTDDPDVVTLLASAYTAHRVLRGPALGDVVAPVPPGLLRRSVLAVIPDILAEIEGDERNTLLALARILITLQTGEIVSKDAAADAIIPTLTGTDRDLLKRARGGYLDAAADDWSGLGPEVTSLAHTLAHRATWHRSTC